MSVRPPSENALSSTRINIAGLTHLFLLNANGKKIPRKDLMRADRVAGVLASDLTPRTFASYRNIIRNFLEWCQESLGGRPLLECMQAQHVADYLLAKIKQFRWSSNYSRLVLTVLNKYLLTKIPESDKPQFKAIKKKAYKIITNKFDLQSYNDEQLKKILEHLIRKTNADDLLFLIVVMLGCGLRFAETRQLTLGAIGRLLEGGVETIQSAKIHTMDKIRMMGKFRAGDPDNAQCKLMIQDRPIGDLLVDKLNEGIWIHDSKNKPVQLTMDDKIFFKTYESYRKKFKPIVNEVIVHGTGIYNSCRGSKRGLNFHSGRRYFANSIHDNLDTSLNASLRTNVVARGLRHSSTGSTVRYLTNSEDRVVDLYEGAVG